jgi:LacI family transcriptional regulator
MARNNDEGLQVIRQIVESRLADGVIFSGTSPRYPRIDYLLKCGFPFVTMGRSKHHDAYPYVDIDSEGAAYAGTKRLAELGHRRIALINPPADLMYAQQRIDGYNCALNESGISLDPKLISSGRLTAAAGKAAMLSMGRLASPPTAYLCANEATALGVTAGLGESGLKVGWDAVVIAADDINVSGYFTPPLSTYFTPIETISRCLGEFLLRRIDGDAPQNLQRLYEPQLIERQSDRLMKRDG